MAQTFKPLLSVITVVYNNVEHIERTVKSAINQSYPNIEYVVIDGASTDGTLNILKKYHDKIDVLISEPDQGIYEAMNKGLDLAKGDYVLFMNSGDEIFATDTVENVFNSLAFADIYYGETEMLNEQLQSEGRRRHQAPDQLSLSSFRYGMSVSHQAIYVKKSITKSFDPKYQLSADIDWILDAISKAKTIVNTHQYVAKYLMGGLSKQKHRESLMERYEIFKKYYGFIPNIFNHLIIAVKLGFYWLKNQKTND
ncbi:MAG: glycosyltransferase [Bacteroidetes bacterium]|nr:glycosyltransferase [Bacteroidota bacterium]MBU1374152.1 glycosyltransferase [Bacteroidota bacterium]MBU1484735.1 glycosyltransferase [Bacteroidota bacterium]MBU1761854.1 glycosyltransferase [Bacteroidota bacterium]MBU2046192.1 glycosyltransferase [Bacteroidota bacterium]